MNNDISSDLERELTPILRSGDTTTCELKIAQALEALPKSPFHVALDLSISTPSAEVAEFFDGFFQQEASHFKMEAAYTEMVGLWNFNAFGYSQYGGHDDYEWLTDWQSRPYDDMTLTGLEPLQEARYDQEFREAYYVAHLLAIAKFQDLIRRAASQMRELRFPLLATGHEYEFIFEARPPGWQESQAPRKVGAILSSPLPKQTAVCSAEEAESIRSRYDESHELRRYIWRNYNHTLTAREHALHVASRLESMAQNTGPKTAARHRQTPGYFIDADVMSIVATGLETFEQKCCERLLRDYGDLIYINRCERCNRIVASPLACACLWCGHHWYDRRPEMIAQATSSIYPNPNKRKTLLGGYPIFP